MPRTPPDPDAPFAAWLRRRMDGRGLTAGALAAQLGVSREAVAAWRRGKQVPGDASRPRVAAALGTAGDPMPPLPPGRRPPPPRTAFGNRLAREAARRDLGLGEVADRAGVPRTALVAWARDGAAPDSEAVARLAAVLGVEPETLDGWAWDGDRA